MLEKNGSYVGDPLKVAEIYNPYIRGFAEIYWFTDNEV